MNSKFGFWENIIPDLMKHLFLLDWQGFNENVETSKLFQLCFNFAQ